MGEPGFVVTNGKMQPTVKGLFPIQETGSQTLSLEAALQLNHPSPKRKHNGANINRNDAQPMVHRVGDQQPMAPPTQRSPSGFGRPQSPRIPCSPMFRSPFGAMARSPGWMPKSPFAVYFGD